MTLLAVKLTPLLPMAQLGQSFYHNRQHPDCVQSNGAFCVGWAVDNFHNYVGPALKQVMIVSISVAVGFVIAMGLALLSHRYGKLVPPLTGFTGILYTVPSLAFFALLIPITGFGTETAVIALSAYTLQIIYRNIVAGLNNVPAGAKDAGQGMGMTRRQLLWGVELPLAVPEIIAGLRVATVSTVALATLAFFAGAGGLGEKIYTQLTFKTNILLAGGLAMLMAIVFDGLLVAAGRLVTPWRRDRAAVILGGLRRLRRSA
ncbi:MAG TPA: ABC transporter permease [Solirubrobacterales bacterium]|nr:ABC transporter permease [Solirubrobacterales bacterium]